MQFQTILSVLSVAIAASALPSPTASTGSCNAPSVVACCDAFATNGTGIGCIQSTLNILNPTCASSQSLACCSGSPSGVVVVQCVPISIAL